MKKQPFYLSAFLALTLVSCQNVAYAKEARAEIKTLEAAAWTAPANNPALSRAASFFRLYDKQENYVYSPLSVTLTDMVKDGELSTHASYVLNFLNVETTNFKVASVSALATTNGVEEERKQELLTHGVDVFEGTIDELQSSLADHFHQDVKLGGNPGEYYLNYLEVYDRFSIPAETEQRSFNGGPNRSFAKQRSQGSYLVNDYGKFAEVRINKTTMRFYLPAEGVKASPAYLLASLEKMGRVRVVYPEFSLRTKHHILEGDRYLDQDASFACDRYGIKGKAFTVNGPTATDPSADFELVLDRPFYFVSFYQNVPTFLGRVVTL